MMKLSGYSERYKEMIINSAWSAWDKMLNKVSKGVTPLYRVREWRKNKSYKEKKGKGPGGSGNLEVICPMSPQGADWWLNE